MLAAEVGFDVLECEMEGSFTWAQRQVQPPAFVAAPSCVRLRVRSASTTPTTPPSLPSLNSCLTSAGAQGAPSPPLPSSPLPSSHQELRRAFYAFAQTSACPLIAILGDDRGSDAETAVSSVLRRPPITPAATLSAQPSITPHAPPSAATPWSQSSRSASPLPRQWRVRWSACCPFPYPTRKPKMWWRTCAQTCDRCQPGPPVTSPCNQPPHCPIKLQPHASHAPPFRCIALSLLRPSNAPQVPPPPTPPILPSSSDTPPPHPSTATESRTAGTLPVRSHA